MAKKKKEITIQTSLLDVEQNDPAAVIAAIHRAFDQWIVDVEEIENKDDKLKIMK